MATWINEMKIQRPILWGHSDGAVIAALMGIRWPERYAALVLEAFHLWRVKPGSRRFFETMADDPDRLGEKVCKVLREDHGEERWRKIIHLAGRAWLHLAATARDATHDLYDGRLPGLTLPTLLIHGDGDPRTEPGELEAVRERLPRAAIEVITDSGHSPHSQTSVADHVNRVVGGFLGRLPLGRAGGSGAGAP
jgi:pimeloyl-ACP methyl ester carboxylesterase